MTIFHSTALPSPQDYVENRLHEGKVCEILHLYSLLAQFEDARIYNMDLCSMIQGDDNAEWIGWHAYYDCIISAITKDGDASRSVSKILSGRGPSKVGDATLLFFTFAFLSEHFTKCPDERILQVVLEHLRKPRPPPNASVASNHNPQSDQIWNLLRVPEITNAFNLSQAARKMTCLYPNHKDALIRNLAVSTAVVGELGQDMVRAFLGSAEADTDLFSNYVNRYEVSYPSDSKECFNAKIDEILIYIDSLTSCHPFPTGAVISELSLGFAIAIPMDLRISTARLLIRVARANQRMDRLAEGFLILDDMEGTIITNCSHYDVGMFHLARTELLIKLSESFDESGQLLIDALKSIQLSVAALDKSMMKNRLLQVVGIAVALCDRLDISGMRNFYSVKFLQIKASDEGMSERFFPSDDDSSLGQPKIPSDITLSPKSPQLKKPLLDEPPLSPIGTGRGLQTLIKWTSAHRSN